MVFCICSCADANDLYCKLKEVDKNICHMKKNLVLNIHAFSGLFAGIFILLMSLSGAVLVFHDDMDAVYLPENNPDNKPVTVDSCYKMIQLQYPRAQLSNAVLPSGGNRPFSFFIYDSSYKDGIQSLEVFINPQTGKILTARGSNSNLISRVSEFHKSFHLGKTGEWLLGFFALIFLLSLLTGVVLYRKNILAVLLFKKHILQKNNLHQLIGVYALLFNLMIATTGFWMQRYVFKKEFFASDTYQRTLKTSPGLPYNFDSACKQVKKQFPDFTAGVIYFAQNNSGKTAVYGSRVSNGFIHSKKFADVIFLDSSGSMVKTRFINEIDGADRYDIINSQLHMGRFGGVGIKIIYFVFGLTGALLSITGFLLWWKRRKQK